MDAIGGASLCSLDVGVLAWRRGLTIGSIRNSVEPDESLKDNNQVSCLL